MLLLFMRSTGQWMRWCARILRRLVEMKLIIFLYTSSRRSIVFGVWTPVASSVNALRSSFHTLFFIFQFFLFRKNYISLSSLCRIFNDICVRCKCIKSAYKLICSVNTSIVSLCVMLSAQMQWKSSMEEKSMASSLNALFYLKFEMDWMIRNYPKPMGDHIRSKFESNKKPLKMRCARHASKFVCST